MSESEKIYDICSDDDYTKIFRSEEEKASEILYNSEGEKLVYIGDDLWIPESSVMSPEELQEDEKRFSHPKIKIVEVVIQILLPLVFISGIVIAIYYIFKDYWAWVNNIGLIILLGLGLLLFYSLCRTKSIIIFFVHVYQAKAPMHVRKRCGFTPTCSDYMILAIKKYGTIRGVTKGIKRLKRCKGQHEEDWP